MIDWDIKITVINNNSAEIEQIKDAIKTDTWKKSYKQNIKIELIHVSGGNGSTNNLIFKKI